MYPYSHKHKTIYWSRQNNEFFLTKDYLPQQILTWGTRAGRGGPQTVKFSW